MAENGWDRRNRHTTPFEEEDLLCACWCEAHFVRVTRDMLKKGLTFPCGVKKCVAIAEERGWNPPEVRGMSPEQMEHCYA